ncbi:putative lectin [Phytophthora cinnamomi]|uniref:putative lectin n=1 Tax=Phytophthora cinnamomi TaxID=4785 RepID=UPI003559CE71|nr:putative lectin [Phytophthora cinnamomi]
MRLLAFSASAAITLSAADAAKQTSTHLHTHKKAGACTIANESQCGGQNWTGSTCRAGPKYECRWSEDGQNVQRGQSIATDKSGVQKDYIDGEHAYIADWGNCTSADTVCSELAKRLSEAVGHLLAVHARDAASGRCDMRHEVR